MRAEEMTASEAKQPYTRPAVVVYGSVRDLTLSNATDNMNDKGNGSFTMT